jgi:hypothetical protein
MQNCRPAQGRCSSSNCVEGLRTKKCWRWGPCLPRKEDTGANNFSMISSEMRNTERMAEQSSAFKAGVQQARKDEPPGQLGSVGKRGECF